MDRTLFDQEPYQQPESVKKAIAELDRAAPLADPALARNTDPQTSHDAAHRVDTNRLEGMVMRALEHGAKNSKEIAEFLGVDKWSISPRMAPLVKKGLVMDSGIRRGKSIVWIKVTK